MENISVWKAISKSPRSYTSLNDSIEVDVAIVGGGITGVTTALALLNAGKKVAILEAESIGGVTTGFSSGNLYVGVQPYYQQIVKKFDIETAKAIAHSRQSAIDYIEKIIKQHNIDCHFSRRPWYLYSNDEDKLAFLKKEVETLKQLGMQVDYAQALPLPFEFKKAAVMENQARFNSLQYVMDLANQLSEQGCLIYENTRIENIKEEDALCLLKTKQGQVTAKNVVLATHTPIGIHALQMFTAPYRSYAIAVKLKNAIYPEGHFWDLNNPHHATSVHAIDSEKPDTVIVSGNHHKVGQANDATAHYEGLIGFAKRQFDISEVTYKWSAQHYHSVDDVPYVGLGRFSKHVYVATGYFADGLVYGTLAGIIISKQILDEADPLATVYKATRFKPFASLPSFLKENGNVLLQYMKDYPLFTKQDDYSDVKSGQGKIVEVDREKWAVSRDATNKLHMVSAVCTHMKCIVGWNNAEKTWDCPCHGSRFTCEGKVIEGPAIEDLKRRE